MIQLLSSKFQKHAACFILLTFYMNTVLAGRGYLFGGQDNAEKNYSFSDSYWNFKIIPPADKIIAEPGKTHSNTKANDMEEPVKKIPVNEKEKPVINDEEKKVDIGGPDQPEMTAFKAAGANNMVDLFTGDFSYNIPLGEVGGYPLNIFYNGGISMDQEASWVGLGWNINPGNITRNKRGVPDDFNGNDTIKKEMNIKPQITVGVGGGISYEFTGFPMPKIFKDAKASINGGIFYNNYRGVGLEMGTRFNVLKLLKNMGDGKTVPTDTKAEKDPTKPELAFNLNSQSGVNVNASLGIQINGELKNNVQYGTNLSLSANFNSRIGLSSISLSGEVTKTKYSFKNHSFFVPKLGSLTWVEQKSTSGPAFNSSSALSFGIPSITPSINMPLTHRNYNLGVKFGSEVKPMQLQGVNIYGYYSEAKLSDKDKIQTKPAYGYLYYQDATGNKDAMLDFNRLNDVVYTKNNPTIAIPNYTFDVFAINGQGIGGGFRAYRGDIGSVHDNYTRSRENAASIDVEIGVGDVVEFGVNLNYVHTPTTAGEWQVGNLARQELQFQPTIGVHEAAYFKNPAEAAKVDQQFLDNLGNEDLVRIRLDDAAATRRPLAMPSWERFSNGQTYTGETIFADNKTRKDNRDKRTQVISYLTAEEATYVGLEKKIYYYPENYFPDGQCKHSDALFIDRVDRRLPDIPLIRKSHHLSEITVTQTDGKRYVYGIPVYNLKEEEVSFNINKDATKDLEKQLVGYNATTDLKTNKNGKDWFYEKDAVDPYAHSFLLTGLLSPDYVDVTGDGITDDDMGTSVKFNYSKIATSSRDIGFGWRAPFTGEAGQAAYNDGLKTDKSDDKGHYTYGERELWYLNSIESKNMIATFTISSRRDGKAVADAMGGRSTTGMRQLDKIDIYSKAEWVKTTGTKKPVKTIHFEYYDQAGELCHNTPDNGNSGGGKLTLKRIWFTYNGNEKLKKNYYSFKYNAVNPDYNRTSNDRWGTYKPASANGSSVGYMDFSTVDNADYPFADQDKSTADANAAAWTLSEITLPSGAKIKVDFESDDYAYVQDRRAAQMFKIAGFGKTPSDDPSPYLYNANFSEDNLYIFIDAPATSKSEIYTKYLEGINQLFMKLWVRMPHDQYTAGTDYEAIPIYALIDNYGLVDNNRFWIKVQGDRGRYSPMFYNSMQFLIKNLASKAYPGSDVKGNGPLGILKAMAGMVYSVISLIGGYYNTARASGTCKTTDADDAVGNHSKSYIRLNNPYFKKLGGGLRVKKVTIKDSWKILTSTDQGNTNGVPESEYGQEYDYTTTALVNGEETTISSGVAAYEPAVGAEENPFREILRYDDRQPLGPNERGAIELPLGEVFYPSPSVGYSKVTVRSIHRDNVKSGVGKNVSEFYTTKDFPTKSDHIDFDGNSHYRFKSNPILRLLKIDVREIVTLSQGFRLQTNDMDGKMHTQTSYDETGKQITYTENIYRIVKTGENKYAFNNLVPMITDPKNNIENLSMGKEIEVMTDFREHFTRAITFNLNFNVNTNLWGPYPIPVPSLVPPVHFAETGYRSASALKIVNTYGILEKVRHIDKGSEVSTKDLLYDAETGAVLATETNNEFNKPLYSFSYPAHWAYPEMQGASKNIGAVFEHVRFQNGKITTAGVDLNEFMKVFESGDELFVSDHSNAEVVDEPGCYPSGPPVTIPKSRDPDDNSKFVRKIWALNMNKDPDNTESKFLFIDKNGDPYSGADVTIKIIRSGKRNLVEASVGGFTSLANPLRTVGSDLKLIVDDETKIINTTANTFKEKWRVDEAFYTKDSIQTVVRLATVLPANVAVTQSAAFGEYRKKNKGVLSGFTRIYRLTPNPSYFIATQNNLGSHQEDYRIRSWVLFNFDNLPDLDGNSKIVSAEIHLPSHWDNHDIYVGEEYVHTNHSSLSPHYSQPGSPNDFVLSRMKSDWPSFSNVNAWRQKYDAAPPGGEENQLPVKGTAPERSNKDYNLDITKVVREMIKDKFDPSKNFATGIMINRLMESQRPPINVSRVCFDVNSWFFSNRKISIDLRYYNCTPDNPIVYIGPASGAPTIPPPGYAYCTADEVTTLCFSHFTRKRMNPYTKGVLGNWRADVGYVYYDNRRESDAAAVTEELSKGGVIATNYKSFWISPNTGDGIVINNDAINGTGGNPATWKWNSKVTQFNNKGFELENTDPLGRFNCGLYGYDKSLPVAVANNSKLRSAAFDGFEDYSYQSNNCAVFCKPQRHLVIDNAASHIVNTERHSGVSSLKLGPNESISAHANIITAAADALGYDINIQNLITTTTGTWVTPNGTGIQGHYFNFGPLSRNFLEGWKHFHERVRDEAADVLNSNTGFTSQNDPYVQKQSNGNFAFFLNPGIQPPPGIGNRPPTVNGYDYYCVRWEAWVQAPYSGVYTFRVISDDGMRVFVDGNLVNLGNYFINHGPMPADFTINCSIGVPHQIRIDYYEEEGASTSYLTWRKPGFTNFEVVPKDYLFLTEAGALAAVTTGTFTCEKPDIIQVKDNALTDVFSPIQGQKMVFSAWVKEGAAACQCDNYTSNQAQVFFDNSTTATFNFTPTGKIIEGWQRYEAVFDIPANATSMEVKLRSTGDKDVYWDDLRIHPFNANMKSFVYHPVTLRLMAEQDENNYSSFYEYDDDGTLIRVKKETERGIKTITETRSALQKKITE